MEAFEIGRKTLVFYRAGGRRGGLDFGLPARPMAPSRTPPLDLGLLEQPKGPLKRGGLDLGLEKNAEPYPRGGVLQSDHRIILPRIPRHMQYESSPL